jgi:hypothetical protein
MEADEDGFFVFPIPGLLKLLYSHTSKDEFKQILKKMNQTVDSIFLEPNLPAEGKTVTLSAEPKPPRAAPAPPAPASPAAPLVTLARTPSGDDMLELGRMVEDLEAMLPQQAAAAGTGVSMSGAPGMAEGYAAISLADRDAIVKTVAAAEGVIKNTSRHLIHIMEALSFQDLSGQRIKKIVGLISDIQVQLLSLLVSVNSKIKAHKDAPQTLRPKEEQEKVAQEEVDRMLEKLNAEPSSELKGPGAEGRLDQGAVNDLLAQLGF